MDRATLAFSGDWVRSGSQWASIVELLRSKAQSEAHRKLYTFLPDGPTSEHSLTFTELDQRARAIGARLQSAGAARQQVLLLFPPGLDYIAAFFGCLYAEAVAVPAYPPRQNRNLERLKAVAFDARPIVVLTTQAVLSQIEGWLNDAPDLKTLQWIAIESIGSAWAAQWQQPSVNEDTLAFLQYTSGSTASPKGVMITHGNLLHNEAMIQRAFGQSEQSIIVGWLPLFHDMGLIGNVLQPLCVSAQCVLLSPMSFLQKPFRWLETISKYHATTSGGPNFAYDFCVRKISPAQRETLDLSSWTIAFNGAEPVRPETLDRFCAAFGSCGFRRQAFFPCYGLAEATLFVSGGPKETEPRVGSFKRTALEQNNVVLAPATEQDARSIVSCGEPANEQQIRIVNPATFAECTPGQVGEIWVAGASIAHGYWNKPGDSSEIFQARIDGSGEGPYLRTGDLGFTDDGQLFITGRLKDLIIIRGRNCYSEDIEHSVGRCDPTLRPGEGAAFSLEVAGEERLFVVHEVTKDIQADKLTEVVQNVRKVLSEEHDLQLYCAVLIKPGTILKTSSGKVRRQAVKSAFVKGKLDVVFRWELPQSAVQHGLENARVETDVYEETREWIATKAAAMLGLTRSQIDLDQSIARYGVDSLAALELAHSIELNFGVALPVVMFLQDVTITELASQVLEQQAQPPDASAAAQTVIEQQQSFPLSHGQAALWFLYRLAPQNASYNVVGAARICGRLNVAALRSSFQLLTERHPELRVTFETRDAEPVQTIHEDKTVCFVEEDASDWSEEKLKQRIAEEAHRPFNLEKGPVFRVTLFALASGEHLLLLAAHHIVIDMWSLAVLVRELGQFYTAQETGTKADVQPLAISYQDYVYSQQQMLLGQRGEHLLEYWQRQLAGELPVLNLNTDYPRPSLQTYEGASASIRFKRETVLRLQILARTNLTTVYTVLLAAYLILLHRHTGQEELIVGTPTTGRTDARFQELVGYFVNTIPIRANVNAALTFRQLLAHVRELVLSGLEHQEYPFALLVNNVSPDRDPSRSPVFQTTFVFEKTPPFSDSSLTAFVLGEPGVRLELGSLTLESVKVDQEIAQFDLSMVVAPIEDELTVALQYNRDLFNRRTITRMLEHFKTLVEEIVAHPEVRLSEINLLTQREQKQLKGFNQTRADYAREDYLHQLFEAQVEKMPAAIAESSEAGQLSYQEVNQRANRLAHYLRTLGVGPEKPVGILLERRPELIVSLLAVLKAGGAYLPLDPAYPSERLRFMLEDTGAAVVISEERLRDRWPNTRVVSIDGAAATSIAQQSEANPQPWARAENLSHIIYTSGSTGRPKGVAITHGSVVNFLHWAEQSFTAAELAGVLAGTSICFDLSVFEIFAPLSCGGTVILAEDALHLATHEAAGAVTLINTVPSAMAELLRLQAVGANVLAVNLAGEALPLKLVQQLYGETRVRRVQNLYGPTEYTTYTTGVEVARESDEAPTIGRPIANTEVYLVGQADGAVPLGVSGEVLVGGCGLARCYWERPELTAERFIPDGLSGAAGERLYRTGDLGRYQENGEIEYLGRKDHQVKIRGYRIELGEIETALLHYPGIKSAAVTVREDQPGEKQMVAYIVAESGQATGLGQVTGLGQGIGSDELRDYLQRSLPGYMVPQFFVTLESMPLTRNGKVDRQSLPAVETIRESTLGKPDKARTPIEELLTDVWCEVLGGREVSATDNFFDVGGHSLKAVQIVSRVADRLHVELPVRVLFEAPTVRRMASLVEQAMMLERDVQRLPVEPVSREGKLPLSFGQQRLWFLHRLHPSSSAYNVSFSIHFTGALNVPALAQTINEIVRRHESLRTTFVESDDGPRQVIAPEKSITVPEVDLRGVTNLEERAQQLAQKIVIQEAQRPFDLAQRPLVRVSLLRLSEQECVLNMSLHHIVCDGWSMAKLSAEMFQIYQSFSKGKPSPLSDLRIQYADFAHWQRQRLLKGDFEKDLTYWRAQLADAPPTVELLTDSPRLVGGCHSSARVSHALPTSLHEELKALGRREGATLYMVLLSCFYSLLSRYSQQTDICIGTPIANRGQSECEPLIGFFVNTVVMRANLSGDPSFRTLLQQIRELSLSAYAHQDLPFEQLVEALQPERSISHAPLFQVAFSFEDALAAPLEIERLKVSVSEAESGTAKFDLLLTMRENDAGLNAVFEYNRDLFNAVTIEQMAAHFDQLLAGVVADPEQRLSSLALLTHKEQRQLLEWGLSRSDYPHDKTVSQLFEEQVERTPNTLAVAYGNDQLSYAELNDRANRLAHYLQAHRVAPESMVAILMERSVEFVIALLGTLKAGGTYVPLDPTYPSSRLAFMLADTEPAILLTQQHLTQSLPANSINVLCLDSEWATCAVESPANLAVRTSPDYLAYVMYTSGSTGQPKGVGVTHRAINRLVRNTNYIQLDAGQRIAQISNVSFDAATFEIWGALLNGGQLVGLDRETSLSARELARQIVLRQISTMFLTTALFNQIALTVPEAFASLEYLLFGGEESDPQAVRQVLERGKPRHLLHVYGPTENTTFTTWYEVTDVGTSARTIPIGRSISNSDVWVLDQHANLTPVGVTGELYLGGEGLATGYWRRPELTAERFVPDPFSGTKGSRLYRTGDKVRWLSEGELEFRGRMDQQVKLRGHRVELGEIEAVLEQHSSTREVVVVARDDGDAGKRLVAYVVPEGTASAKDLRSHLREHLPEYMLPSVFVFLEKLPLTANGKVDRRALPKPTNTREQFDDGFVAPRTEVEKLLAAIWCELLQLDEVGIYDNFFDLGGHSLLATQVISRIRHRFNVDLPLSSLFEAPQIATLSEQVESAFRSAQGLVVPPLSSVNRTEPLPLSFAQQRLWFLQRLDPASTAYNISFNARLNGALNWPALENSINEIIRRHEALRTTFTQGQTGPVQLTASHLVLVPVLVDLSGLTEEGREEQTRRLIDEEAGHPFDLEVGPLVRMNLLRLSREECVLSVSMHHTISDGWSCGILIREMMAHYEAFCAGLPSPVPPLEVQYGDFAVWQRQWLEGAAIDSQLAYWNERLSEPLAVLELPADRPRPPLRSDSGAVISFNLPPELTGKLKNLAQREGATLFMTLLAAFQLLLSRYSGQTDVLVGTPVANRGYKEIEPLIGNFVNTLVMRIDLSGNPSFRELLARVRDLAIGAYTHQDVPFERLVSELHAERDLSRTPLFQVMMVLQNTPLVDLKLKEIELRSEETDNGTAKFDLTVMLTESEDGIDGKWEYSTDLFDAITIERMVAHFQILLEGVVTNDLQPISEINILADSEQQQLKEFNQTRADYAREEYLHQLFEAQVEKTPAAIAVSSEAGQLSYQEVNQRANRLAHYLRQLGVGPEKPVAILLERRPELIVSLLAVLKAGGAYLPLDPAYPSERLRFMLEDTGAAVVISEERLRDRWPNTRVVSIDGAAATSIAQQSEANPQPWARAENLSHIIYTSGSTGRPKGVAITHGSVVNFLHWAEQSFTAAELAGVLAGTSICFDLSVFEIFAPLSCGGTVILAEDALHLATHEAAGAVTLINTVPSAMVELLRLQAVRANVLAVNLAGEALSLKLVQQLYGETRVRRVQNLYGPTEYTTYTTGVEVARESDEAPTIGRPIANTEVYLVGEADGAVPLGVSGEVLVGGCGLARCYWERPELTAERFIPDGLSGAVGERLYRTGDLGRYQESGEIEYLGRKDHQVKIRGYRIELGEIEAVLGTFPGVDAAAVVAKQDDTGHKYLAAYVVGDLSETDDLRRFLHSKLPSYMVPATLTRLEQLHLTPNGKIDRKSLPEPARETDSAQYKAPRTPAEKILASIWQQVLKVDRVGIHDNFFDLGGDSILSIHVVTQARRAGLALTPRQFFQHQTIAKLALVTEEADRGNGHKSQPADLFALRLNPDDIDDLLREADKAKVEDIYPLTPFQQGMLFHVLEAPDAGMYLNQQRYTLRGEIDLAAFKNAFQAIVNRHQILRTAFILSARSGPLQVVYRDLSLPWVTYDWRNLSPSEESERVEALLRADYEFGFDLKQAPLTRVTIVRRNPDVYEFIWTFHLLLMDGWSVPILFNELLALYHAFRTGEAAQLDEPIPYSAYIEWLQQQPLDQAEAYWRHTLAGFSSPTSLGFDRTESTGAPEETRYKEQGLVLDEQSSNVVRSFAAQHRLTLNTLIQGAWALLLSRRSGTDDVVFGSVVSGRAADFPGIDSAVGVFVNAIPARVRIPGDGEVAPWLEDLQKQQVEARRFEFCSLVDIQGWSEVPRQQPLFESALIFQNIPSDVSLPESEGVSVVSISSTERSNLPLALIVEPATQLRFRIVYQSNRFEEPTIARILQKLQRTLIEIASGSNVALSSLASADVERKLLVDSFNQSLATF
jgi:amino acid adenylation domain-containing protein